ncbi:MAG: TIM barrel protein [Planctomycetota bacterium]|nr:TIM barrel protein [Planctomycetota bacterium]
MQCGLVSNCWRTSLDAGCSLEDLIAEAAERGYRAVELRQTCLGAFESGDDHRPRPELLAELPTQFPGMRFNIAVCVPFLDKAYSAVDAMFELGRLSAIAVAGEAPPHLRLVDLQTSDEQFKQIRATANVVCELAQSMQQVDGYLSVEHSMQSWRSFYAAFNAARELLRGDQQRLRLCYDPCNLLMSPDDPDPTEVTRGLSADELSMVHIKQRSGGRILKDVRDGNLNWAAQFDALAEIGFREPFLYEVAASDELWDRLDRSQEYLQAFGFTGVSESQHSLGS